MRAFFLLTIQNICLYSANEGAFLRLLRAIGKTVIYVRIGEKRRFAAFAASARKQSFRSETVKNVAILRLLRAAFDSYSAY